MGTFFTAGRAVPRPSPCMSRRALSRAAASRRRHKRLDLLTTEPAGAARTITRPTGLAKGTRLTLAPAAVAGQPGHALHHVVHVGRGDCHLVGGLIGARARTGPKKGVRLVTQLARRRCYLLRHQLHFCYDRLEAPTHVWPTGIGYSLQ
eukprot:scaffold87891_cov23-Tisochrysis_lutea.AAC.3